jgi:hypothetical protein
MWRETDSWFELRFKDGSKGFAHLSPEGNYIGLFNRDGFPVTEENIEYTCVNDNVSAPVWYFPPQE